MAITDGDIAPLDTEITAYAWMGALNEVVIRWIYTGEPDPERAFPACAFLAAQCRCTG